MQLTLPKSEVQNTLAAMRRAGYSVFTDPVTKKESFVLRFGNTFYPRFHVYVSEKAEQVFFDIHLDQKQPSYGGDHMHNGEYDGPVVEKELQRIASWVRAGARNGQSTHHDAETPKKSPKPRKGILGWFS